jgi:hypothetical protein
MKWAVEIQRTSLERRNLVDLLAGLHFKVVDGIDSDLAFTPLLFEQMDSTEVWAEAKKLREAMIGPAEIDPDFTLGAVIDYSASKPKRHRFLEARMLAKSSTGPVTLTLSPPKGLSEKQLAEWQAMQEEQEYQARKEAQLSKLEPVYREPRAAKILELLKRDEHTGESLYKIFELLVGGDPKSKGQKFCNAFGVSKDEFKRFAAAVHNPDVSGDFARHAYSQQHVPNPMTPVEAERFVRRLVAAWLNTLRKP